MDDAPTPPLVLANRVIQQFVEHLVGETAVVLPQDYLVMRMVFRWCKGSWERVVHGDIVHNRLLVKIVTTWGAMPDRKHHSEMG